MSNEQNANPQKRYSKGRIIAGSFMVLLAFLIACSPMAWAEWQIANGMDYRGAWTTVAILGIFVWGIAAIVAIAGIAVALIPKRITK